MARSVDEAIEQIRTADLPAFEVDLDKYIRVVRHRHKDGLGFSKLAKSRFSDPESKASAFGVIYAGQDLATSVSEVIIRDTKVGNPGRMLLGYKQAVDAWRAVIVSSERPLRLLNLTGVGLIQFGVPTDVIRQKSQRASRRLAKAIHENKAAFDGILYGSRITTGQCIAVFDRGISKLRIDDEIHFRELEDDLATLYTAMNVAVYPA